MTLKLNLGDPKTGKTYKKDLAEDESKVLHGKKIGDAVKGDLIGLAGYEFEITGGSDSSGFPMRKDVNLAGKKRILTTSEGVGFNDKRKGLRKRRTVAGNTIYAKTVQVNMKITKQGKQPLDAPAETAEDAPAEEAKTEAPKEEAKEKPAEKEEKSDDKPAEQAAEENSEEKEAAEEAGPAESSDGGKEEKSGSDKE